MPPHDSAKMTLKWFGIGWKPCAANKKCCAHFKSHDHGNGGPVAKSVEMAAEWQRQCFLRETEMAPNDQQKSLNNVWSELCRALEMEDFPTNPTKLVHFCYTSFLGNKLY